MNEYTISIPVRLDVRVEAHDLESALRAVEHAFRKEQPKDDLQGVPFDYDAHGVTFEGRGRVMGAIAQGGATLLD